MFFTDKLSVSFNNSCKPNVVIVNRNSDKNGLEVNKTN